MSSRTRSVAVAVRAMTGTRAREPPEGLEVAVVGPELVSPLGYAVGFVHGYEAEFDGFEEAAESGLDDAFGGDVEQLEFAVVGHSADAVSFRSRSCRC